MNQEERYYAKLIMMARDGIMSAKNILEHDTQIWNRYQDLADYYFLSFASEIYENSLEHHRIEYLDAKYSVPEVFNESTPFD